MENNKNLEIYKDLGYILEAVKTGLNIIDADYNVRFASNICVRDLGPDYSTKKCYEYFAKGTSPCKICAVREALLTKKTVEKEATFANLPNKLFRVTAVPFLHVSSEWLVAEISTDITNLKKSQKISEENEKNYSEIFENAVEGIFKTSVDGKLLQVNPALAQMFEYDSPKEMMANVLDLKKQLYVNGQDREEFKRVLSQEGVIKCFKTQMFTKYKKYIWISLNAKAIKDNDGKILYYQGTAENITEIKELQKKNAQQEKHNKKVIDIIQEGVLIMDEEGIISFVNNQLCQMLGLVEADIVGKHWSYFVEEEWKEYCEDLIKKQKDFPQQKKYFEFLGKDKKRVFANLSLSSLMDDDENYRGLIVFIVDITKQRQIVDSLLDAEKKYRNIFENINEGLFQSFLDGSQILVNPAFANIFGYNSPEELNMRVTDIARQIYANSNDRDLVTGILKKEGEVKNFEFECKRKDGQKIWVSMNARAVKDEQGTLKCFEGSVQDITLKKEYERSLTLQVNRFKFLYELSLSMSYRKSLKEILDFIVEKACKLLESDVSYIVLADKNKEKISISNYFGVNTEEFKKLTFSYDTGIAGMVMKKREGFLIENECQSRLSPTVKFLVEKEGLVGGMVVPIQTDNESFGALFVVDRVKKNYSQKELDMLLLLGNLAAVEILRSKFEGELKKSEDKFSKTFHCSADAIVISSFEGGRFIDFNPAASEIFGYTREELIGNTVFQSKVWKNISDRAVLLNKIKLYDSVRGFETKFAKKNGEIVDVSISAEKIILDNEHCLLSTIRDVSEKKKTIEALHMSNEACEKKNIALKELIETIELNKKEEKEKIQLNVEKLILPILSKLERKGSNFDKKYIELLRNNLNNLTQSFGLKIGVNKLHLSPREIEICNLIKDGIKGKEISKILNISYASLETHRKNIRRKLGISNKEINLSVYLQDF